MGFSIKLTIKSGWSIVYILWGHRVNLQKKYFLTHYFAHMFLVLTVLSSTENICFC